MGGGVSTRDMKDYLEKEWAVRGPGKGARSKPVTSTHYGFCSLALANPTLVERLSAPPGPKRSESLWAGHVTGHVTGISVRGMEKPLPR